MCYALFCSCIPPYFIHQILHLESSPMNFRKSCLSHLQCCPLKPSLLGRQLLYTNMKNCFNQQLVFINLTMIIWVVGLSLAIFQIDRQHMGPCDYTSLSGWNLYMRLENMDVHLSKINGTWQQLKIPNPPTIETNAKPTTGRHSLDNHLVTRSEFTNLGPLKSWESQHCRITYWVIDIYCGC